jgi:protein-arginine kinase activator protein McsA
MVAVPKVPEKQQVRYCALKMSNYWCICESVVEPSYKQIARDESRYFDTVKEAQEYIKSLPDLSRVLKRCEHCGETYIGYARGNSLGDFCEECWERIEKLTDDMETEEEYESFVSGFKGKAKAEQRSA